MLHFRGPLVVISFVATHLLASFTSATPTTCKTTPDSPRWPCEDEWNSLNQTVGGRLLKPPPPASVCHPDQPTFDLAQCKATDWTNASTYADNPLGIVNPNWSEDCCLPGPKYPCSGRWLPVYVINATCAEDVAAGINFARKYNIRLNVKGSGHDYLGRSTAPNSLSIWTKHIRGIEFEDSFKPVGCTRCIAVPAVTLGAGEDWGDIYAAAHEYNLTLVGGTGDTIGLGGYLTGGGHSPLSAKYGLAVDQVLEMEVVLASGEIVIVNQMQNSELFWAMRGGGGATFGVMTSVTLKTFSDMPVAAYSVTVAAEPDSEAFWNATTYIVSQAPRLQESGIVGYSYLSPSYPFQGATVGGYLGVLLIPNGTIAELESATAFLRDYITTVPGVQASFEPTEYPDLFARYQVERNTAPIGANAAVGNRLLDSKALSNVTALRQAMEVATPPGTLANLNFIAGPGMWAAVPAGGSDSVQPAWRKSYIEYGKWFDSIILKASTANIPTVVPVGWPFLNNTAKQSQTKLLTDVYMAALRNLAPDTGSYLNEGDVNEPDFQSAYYGEHYQRLLSIKQQVDPWDLFWCAVCVGSENWHAVGTKLCRVP